MRLVKLVCAIAFFIAAPAFAVDVSPVPPALVTNGCGSGNFASIVPNRIFQCNFKAACDRHDICYGACLTGGKLTGQKTCDVEADKSRRRQICDKSLQSDIIADNPGHQICGLYSGIYRFVVQRFGEEYFKGITGEEFLAALRIFYKYVEQNPNSFDLREATAVFEDIATTGLNDPEYGVQFFPAEPRLVVTHKKLTIKTLVGKKP